MKRRKLLLELLLTFARIGFFTFGGGYAMISVIGRICVEEKRWITHDDMMNVTVLAESTPGPIAINCATFVGYRQAGFWGALAATFGIVLPSFAVIYALSLVLERAFALALIARAFRGIRLAVGVLILDAAAAMIRKMPKKPFPIAVAAAACAVTLIGGLLSRRISPIALMLLAAAASLLLSARGGGRKEDAK